MIDRYSIPPLEANVDTAYSVLASALPISHVLPRSLHTLESKDVNNLSHLLKINYIYASIRYVNESISKESFLGQQWLCRSKGAAGGTCGLEVRASVKTPCPPNCPRTLPRGGPHPASPSPSFLCPYRLEYLWYPRL